MYDASSITDTNHPLTLQTSMDCIQTWRNSSLGIYPRVLIRIQTHEEQINLLMNVIDTDITTKENTNSYNTKTQS